MFRPNIWNRLKQCVRYYLRLRSVVPRSKVGKGPAKVNRLCGCISRLSVKSQGSRKTGYIAAFKIHLKEIECFCNLPFPNFIGCQFETHEVNLTNSPGAQR